MPATKPCRHALTALTALSVLAAIGITAEPAAAHPGPSSSPLLRFPKGIDVSSHQHPDGQAIDWPAVRAAGVTFAFVKVDEGPARPGGHRYVNPWYVPDWNGAHAAGLLVGPYHYARPRLPVLDTAEADARAFAATTGTAAAAAPLPPVLDIEEPGELDGAQLAAWSRRWLDVVAVLTGRTPLVYTALWYWNAHLGGAASLGEHPLWLARYDESPGLLPGGWREWSFWQFTAHGRVPGIAADVDINLSCGRPTELVNECRAPTYAAWAAAHPGEPDPA